MKARKLGSFDVMPVGLGCMSLSHAYGAPPDAETGGRLLNAALDLGYTHLDTASLYGFGANETLIGNAIRHRRAEYTLASKCGMFRNEAGVREINGDPAILRKTCEESLKRLQTDVIDLYYLHRWDKRRPIEESVGTLADLVREGKIRSIGLSEVSASSLRKAHAVHPIAAVQTEYSLWTRNAETAVLETCRDLGTTFVAFSPLARGFLTGTLRDISVLPPKDIRIPMPRFQPEHFGSNVRLLDGLGALAREQGCTMGQLGLAWVLAQGEHIVVIPGTTKRDHLSENFAAGSLILPSSVLKRLDALINPKTVSGPRYPASTLPEIDTEEVDLARYA